LTKTASEDNRLCT